MACSPAPCFGLILYKMSLIYQINKGINKPIIFKGLQGQYILYLACGLVGLLLAFTLMYVAGLPLYVLLPMVFGLGTALFMGVGRLSRHFGVHGLAKFMARRSLPEYVRFSSRRVFTSLRSLPGNQERQVRR